jgi:hypothetical protein
MRPAVAYISPAVFTRAYRSGTMDDILQARLEGKQARQAGHVTEQARAQEAWEAQKQRYGLNGSLTHAGFVDRVTQMTWEPWGYQHRISVEYMQDQHRHLEACAEGHRQSIHDGEAILRNEYRPSQALAWFSRTGEPLTQGLRARLTWDEEEDRRLRYGR